MVGVGKVSEDGLCRPLSSLPLVMSIRGQLFEAAEVLLTGPRWRRRWQERLPNETTDAYTLRVGLLPVAMFPFFIWLAIRAAMFFKGWMTWTLAAVAVCVLLLGVWLYFCVLWRHMVLRNRGPRGGPF